MNNSKKFILFAVGLIGQALLQPVMAQSNTTIGTVSIASPTAASLGKYGDIPVSYHTGIPDIDIPIYTIRVGPIEMPISLSYHASGLKVQEEASWVGAGWALNAGGVISRTVVGAPDDRGLNSAYTQKGHFSDYGYSSYLFGVGPASCGGSDPNACPVGRSGMPTTNYPPQDSYIQSGVFDGEPDLYFFNFNGHIGKFYFNDDRTPIIEPEQDLQITPIYTGTDWRGMTGFIITTPDGIQYHFGQNPVADGNPDAIEITYDVTTQMSYNGQGAVSSWYLNRIVSADQQDTVQLTYQTESYSYYTYSMFPIPSVQNSDFFGFDYDYDLCKNFTNGVRLTKIAFADGEVDFTPGALRQDMSLGTGPFPNYTFTEMVDDPNNDVVNGARSLGSISIKTSSFCKKDSLYYDYFYDNTPVTAQLLVNSYQQFIPTSDEYRLRLDSMRETSCDASQYIPSYKFSYYSGTVPRKLSMGIDHWGFYNGVINNSDLIPTFTVAPPTGLPGQVVTTVGADRDTHWPYSEGGALQQITYPTGGYTQFTYESNYVYTATPIYTPTIVAGATGGYDNQPYPSAPFTTNYDTYEVVMSSNQPTTQTGGTLELFQGGVNGPLITSFSVTPGQSITSYFTLPPNISLTPEMFDNNNNQSTGNSGVTATIYDLVPSTVYANSQIGGLRIKTITHSDAMTATPQVSNFQYTFNNVTGGQSSGILFSQPVYVQEIRNDAWAQVNGSSCSSLGCAVCFGGMTYYESPSSIRPMATSQGNHIGYGEVYVSQAGNGYTEYQYYSSNGTLAGPYDPPITDVCVRNIADLCMADVPNSPAPPLPFDPQRGELAYKADVNSSGSLLKTVNSIPEYQLDSLVTPGLISQFFVTAYIPTGGSIPDGETVDANTQASGGFSAIGLSTITQYNLQSAKKIRDSVVTRIYDPLTGNSTTAISTVYYGSRYHLQPTQTLTYSSSGQTLVSNITHASDLRISNFNVADQLPAYYTNINNDLLWMSNGFTEITLSPTDPNYFWERLDTFTSWRYRQAIDRQTYLTWRQQTYNVPGNTYATAHTSAETAADGELKPVLVMQDAYQNPVIETSSWNSGNLVHSEYTHHDFSSNPTNSVYPYNTQLINLQAPSTTFSPATVSGNTIARDSRYALESSYNWSQGRLQQSTGHDAIPISYLWNYDNTLPVAKITNATASQAAYTSFEGNGTGNWTYTGAPTADATAITGAYSYNLGQTSGSISLSGLSAGTTYIVSYWSNTTNSNLVNGLSATTKGKSVTISGGTWTYFEHVVTGATTVTVTGSGNIDELRLYPSTSQMKTYTYQPLVGMTTQCDEDNRVTYYTYDALGRLRYIRDQNGNMIKTIQYHYQGQ